jgi:hypothetical protein
LITSISWIYDGNVALQERDTKNLPLVTYTRGNDLSGTLQAAGGIGGLLARTDYGLSTVNSSSAHSYYHADGNGNITALINERKGKRGREKEKGSVLSIINSSLTNSTADPC